MIGLFRGFVSTWAARAFFLLLAAGFVYWGVATQNPFGRGNVDVAEVAGRSVPMQDFEMRFRRDIAERQKERGEVTPEVREALAQQAIQHVLVDASLTARVRALGLAVPDSALAEGAVREVPELRGADGSLDRTKLLAWLKANNMSEGRFGEVLEAALGKQQMIGAVAAGIRAPDALARRILALQTEALVFDVAELPFAGVPAPTPTEAQLRRWFDNHPETYRSPELRRIKAVVLTPETVGRDIAVPDDELRAAYEVHKREYATPERRGLQVLSALPDLATAERLAAAWRTGADWKTVQEQARAAGGAAVEFPDATRDKLPSPDLARVAFATAPGTVATPFKADFGTYVVRVLGVTPATQKTLDQVRESLRVRVATEKAVDLIYDRATRLEDLLAGGAKFDELPGDLGVAAVTGTLDAQGNTADGELAPLSAPPPLRAEMVATAFASKVDEAPRLIQGPNGMMGYFALTVESVTPPAARTRAQAAERVSTDWTRDAARHAVDEKATRVLVAVQAGKPLEEAAASEGATVRRLPPATRQNPPEVVPERSLPALFALTQGESTMVETPTGFLVARLAERHVPPPDARALSAVRDGLGKMLSADVQNTFAAAVEGTSQVQVSARVLADLTRAGE